MDLRETDIDFSRRHPWELARVKALEHILGYLEPAGIQSVLDIGCGDGYASSKLFESSDIDRLVGVDCNFDNEQIAKLSVMGPHSKAVFVKDLAEVPDDHFDLLLLLDVIEHVVDDREFLQTVVSERLTDFGHVLITAPAFQMLFSDHDRFLAHYRRYSRKDLRSLVTGVGLEIIQDGYLFASLLLARMASKGLKTLTSRYTSNADGIGKWNYGVPITKVMELLLRTDNRILFALRDRHVVLPGLSVWALCKKQQ
ncbi:MAG: class I SAM-dependent methyltransferase [Proteobacteria bacterium]|nr:class I SAM-dependent methyltransferase [Pseudomonadota bacterium]